MRKCWCGAPLTEKYSAHYYKCQNCHTLVSDVDFDDSLLKVENEEEDLYGDNYWKEYMCELAGKKNLDEVIDLYLEDRTLYWLSYILQYVLPPARVCEVGAGIGAMLYLLRLAGYEVQGYELSPSICKYVQEWTKVEMKQGNFAEIGEGDFDLICAFDLLEHLLDPAGFIRECSARLNPGGMLCIQMPNYIDAMSYQEMLDVAPNFKTHLTEFQHIHIFSKEAATKLLQENGFSHIEFCPAIFGDDYDMFLFASNREFEKKDANEIYVKMKEQDCGRLLVNVLKIHKMVREKEAVINQLIKQCA